MHRKPKLYIKFQQWNHSICKWCMFSYETFIQYFSFESDNSFLSWKKCHFIDYQSSFSQEQLLLGIMVRGTGGGLKHGNPIEQHLTTHKPSTQVQSILYVIFCFDVFLYPYFMWNILFRFLIVFIWKLYHIQHYKWCCGVAYLNCLYLNRFLCST